MNITGKNKVLLGTNKKTGEFIYITKPSWDCGWYWSFGYLGNRNCHYHLNSYQNVDRILYDENKNIVSMTECRNINMRDALLSDYVLEDNIKENLWVFCELAKTIYGLKESAEIFGRGGAHYTTNPCKDVIMNTEIVDKINKEILPKVLQEFWNLIDK